MSEEESTLNLQALQEACPNSPWALTFSYGRALQVRGQSCRACLPVLAAGDVNSVSIGEKTNVQDNVLIHVARHNPAKTVRGTHSRHSMRATHARQACTAGGRAG